MLTQSTAASQPSTSSTTGSLTAQQRREALKLSFQRSISEPLGGVAGRVIGVPCTVTIDSPPSISPSLHPSKRCKMSLGTSPITTPKENKNQNQLLSPPAQTGSVSLPSSPCSESSTLQRTLLLKNARTIEHDNLATRMEIAGHKSSKSAFLLIDCRPFIAYNVNHIRGAINVNCCDRFNRKRLQQGKATLADLATTKEGKELLKKRTWREVVVYDDCSDSLQTLPASHTLFLVMNALVEDHREPVMLLGGLRDFQVAHRGFCEDHLMHQSNASSHPVSKLLPDLPSPSDLADTKDIENHPATQVLPHLFLGNMRDASDMAVLKRLGISYILNVTSKPPQYTLEPGFHYKHLEAADNGLQNLRQFFEEAFEFIDLAKSNGSGVLVHCQAGISRSPTIAVAYLMKHYPMAMAEAYQFVKMRRSIISPNLNFMGQLWEFEQGLRSQQSEEDTADKEVECNKSPFVPPGSTLDPSQTDCKPTVVNGSTASSCLWSQQQAGEVKPGDGIHAGPPMNGCSV